MAKVLLMALIMVLRANYGKDYAPQMGQVLACVSVAQKLSSGVPHCIAGLR